jgi:hypothetical protein
VADAPPVPCDPPVAAAPPVADAPPVPGPFVPPEPVLPPDEVAPPEPLVALPPDPEPGVPPLPGTFVPPLPPLPSVPPLAQPNAAAETASSTTIDFKGAIRNGIWNVPSTRRADYKQKTRYDTSASRWYDLGSSISPAAASSRGRKNRPGVTIKGRARSDERLTCAAAPPEVAALAVAETL